MLLYSHHPYSRGASALAQALGCRRIRHQGSRFTGRRNPIVVNWGSSVLPAWSHNVRLLNKPEAVAEASNKLTFFQLMDGYNLTPEWTNDRTIAQQWLESNIKLVERHKLSGHSGAGIRLVGREWASEELTEAPLYVKYIPKSAEWRVHLFQGEVIDAQRKARRLDHPDDEVNWRVRNHENGFIYAREGVEDCPEYQSICNLAREAFRHTSLDFGAVDVIYNRRQDRGYVLEINTAPGLEGTTVEKYAEAIRRVI